MSETPSANVFVVDTSRSPHAVLLPVSITAVHLSDNFWEPRRRINAEVTLPAQYRHCEETGRFDNFRRASGKKEVPYQGAYPFNDSDVYKWLEAVSWTLATDPTPERIAMADAAITEIEDAQQADGYLNTFFMFEREKERFTNLRDQHELYCAGHLIQAAVAHYRATGSDRLLRVACRFADLLDRTFGLEADGKRIGTCGHEEIEMTLVELARVTENPAYTSLAAFFVHVRGLGTLGGKHYHQDHQPFRALTRMTGHAVRAVYYNAGVADIVAEHGSVEWHTALAALWENMTARQLYVSGGIGSRHDGEAFGNDYELPNERAYTETCAAIGSVMWNWRMLLLDGDARYADLIERTLYNGVLSGLSLDGQTYFYENPLADDGTHRRQPWFGCACCPPNVARTLASLPGYFYSLDRDKPVVHVHLYAEGEAHLPLPDGRTVQIIQRTVYPWEGMVELTVNVEGKFGLGLRIPEWCEEGATVLFNGTRDPEPYPPGEYIIENEDWKPGTRLLLILPLSVRTVTSHPYVLENTGRVAILRGPLLYCLEAVDNPGFDLRDVVLPANAVWKETFRRDLLGGVVVLTTEAHLAPPSTGWKEKLYRTPSSMLMDARLPQTPVTLTAVPYYAWANREPGAMQVWLRQET